MRTKIREILAKWKNLSLKKKILIIISVILVLVALAAALAYNYLYHKPRQEVSFDPVTGEIVVKDAAPAKLNERLNVLLIAADQRDGSKYYNTDSLIIVSIDPKTESIMMLSIPRDTRVSIPKYGLNKINAAASLGGLNMTVAVVQDLTGVKIDGYIETNFQGFKGIIDTLDGIKVNVEKDMYYLTGDAEDGVIDLDQGEQILDGSKALQYARFRHDTYGDITRTSRQQVVLKAVAQKIMEPGSIIKLPSLVMQAFKMVETNLREVDMITVTQAIAKYDSSKIISQTLPGYFLNIDGISYWGVDPEDAKKVAADLLSGRVVGNTPEAIIKGAEQITTEPDQATSPPADPEPQVKLGVVGIKEVSTTSVTIMVTASSGIASAQLWHSNLKSDGSGNESGDSLVYPEISHTWKGESIIITDIRVDPATEYAYYIKVFDAKGKFLQSSGRVYITTLTVPEVVYK